MILYRKHHVDLDLISELIVILFPILLISSIIDQIQSSLNLLILMLAIVYQRILDLILTKMLRPAHALLLTNRGLFTPLKVKIRGEYATPKVVNVPLKNPQVTFEILDIKNLVLRVCLDSQSMIVKVLMKLFLML